jgi:hypothetical protein
LATQEKYKHRLSFSLCLCIVVVVVRWEIFHYSHPPSLSFQRPIVSPAACLSVPRITIIRRWNWVKKMRQPHSHANSQKAGILAHLCLSLCGAFGMYAYVFE